MEETLRFPGYLVDEDNIRWNLPNGVKACFGQGHVNDIALSPDGRYLAVASDVGVWFYEFSTQSLIAMWDKGRAPYSALTFSYDGQLIAIADSIGIVRVFDLFYGTCLTQFDHGPRLGIFELAFSFDSLYLSASRGLRDENDNFTIDVWQVPKSNRGVSSRLRFKSDCTYEGTSPLAFSIDNRLLACATRAPTRCISPTEEGSISVWNVQTHEQVACLTGLPHFVGSLSFSPCGRLLAAGDWTGTVHVWEISNGYLYQEYPSCGEYYMLVSYSPSGTLYATGVSRDRNTLIAWDLEQAKTCYTSKVHSRYIPIHFIDGARLAFGSQVDFQMYTLDTTELRRVSHLHRAHTSTVLVFSPDQKKLLNTGNKEVFVWTIANSQQPPEIFNPCIETTNKSLSSTVCLSAGVLPDGRYFTIAAYKNDLRLLEVGNDAPIVTFTTLAKPRRAIFSPTTSLLACQDENAQIYLWDTQSEQLRYSYQAEYPESQGMVFSPNGKYFVGRSDLFYDVVQGEKIETFDLDEMSIHLFSPDSTQFICNTRNAIEVWDIHKREKVLSIPKPKTWVCSDLVTLALSPCGKYLAGSCDEVPRELHLWVIDGGNPLTVFKGNAPILSLTFSPDSTLLASGNDDGTILLWDMKPYLQNT